MVTRGLRIKKPWSLETTIRKGKHMGVSKNRGGFPPKSSILIGLEPL